MLSYSVCLNLRKVGEQDGDKEVEHHKVADEKERDEVGADQDPLLAMPSCITAFRPSVSTWNSVCESGCQVVPGVSPSSKPHLAAKQLHAQQREDEDCQDNDESEVAELHHGG